MGQQQPPAEPAGDRPEQLDDERENEEERERVSDTDDPVDLGSELSFPASDPPAY